MLRTRKVPKIETRDGAGRANGFLLPIYNVHESFVEAAQRPQQVYCTVVLPKSVKGPHLHMKRWGLFTCIVGNVDIVVRLDDGKYETHSSGEEHQFQTIQVPAGLAAVLINRGNVPAYVLNMPSPAWRQDDPDDHPVTGWTHPLRTD